MASSQLLFVLSLSSKALLKCSSLLARVRPSPAQLGRRRGRGRGLWGGSVPPVCAQSLAEAAGCPCHPFLLPRWGKAGDVEPQSRCPGVPGSVTSRPCCLCAPRARGAQNFSFRARFSSFCQRCGTRRTGGRFWISPLALPRVPTPEAPGTENPEHLPPDTRLSLDLGHLPAPASPQSPAVPAPLAAPGGDGDRCLQLLPAGSCPLLPTPGARLTELPRRETEEVVIARIEQQAQVYS